MEESDVVAYSVFGGRGFKDYGYPDVKRLKGKSMSWGGGMQNILGPAPGALL